MTRIIELVELAKSNQEVESDNALALRLGVNRQLVHYWKKDLKRPDVVNYARLCKAAGISLNDGLKYVLEGDECILCKKLGCVSDARLSGFFYGTIPEKKVKNSEDSILRGRHHARPCNRAQ